MTTTKPASAHCHYCGQAPPEGGGHWPWCLRPASQSPAGAEGFYVTVIRYPGPSQRVGWLLGPYATKADAKSDVRIGRRLAHQADPFTAFDAFGVTRVVMQPGAPLRRGVLNDRAAAASREMN